MGWERQLYQGGYMGAQTPPYWAPGYRWGGEDRKELRVRIFRLEQRVGVG